MPEADSIEYRQGDNLCIVPIAGEPGSLLLDVRIKPRSRVHELYGQRTVQERYYCQNGLAESVRPLLEAGGLVFSGEEWGGDARILELPGHPFFVGTLFVPQATSTEARPHPILRGFLDAVRRRSALFRECA